MKSIRRGSFSMHRSEKTPGSKYSSTSGLSPRGHLERQAEFHCGNTGCWGERATEPPLSAAEIAESLVAQGLQDGDAHRLGHLAAVVLHQLEREAGHVD